MKKKILSLFCAATLVISTMTSFVVAHAEVTPPTTTFKLNFESVGTLDDTYDEDYAYEDLQGVAPLYKITCTVEGPSPKTATEDGKAFIGATLQSFQTKFVMDCDNSNVVLIKKAGASSSVITAPKLGENVTEFGLAQSLADDATDSFISSTTTLGTWYVFSKDGSAITNVTLKQKGTIPDPANHAVTWGQIWDGTKKGVAAKNLNDTTHIAYVNYPAAPTTYAVTTAATENGTVAVDKNAAAEGETVTITTSPSEGYEVDTVTAGAAEVTGADNTYTFTMPAKTVEVAVTFKAKTVVDPNAAEKLTGNYADGANDNAVAFKKTFDANSLTGKTLMKLTAMVNGVARVYKGDAVAIPNVDGELTLGVVIQYKDATVNVESLAIELQ